MQPRRVADMESDYLTDEEYKTYWYRLEGLRTDISKSLALKQGMRILDVGTGYALFAIEMAKQLKNGTIIGIDIVEDGIQKAKTLVDRADAAEFISIAKTDAVKLPFKDSCFDLATSFLGMRDIYMTRGRRGVRKTLEEMIRVVKLDGRIVLCITPPEDMGTEDQRIAVRLEGEIFGAKSLPKEFYTRIFRQNHIVFKATQAFLTHKKMTANQTRIEFMDGIRIARRIYGRSVPTFSSVWRKYGRKIETHGYGMYSRIVVLEGQKLR